MRALIIEDEKPAARRLNRMLEKEGVTVIKMLHSVAESIEWFKNNEHPDLMFLDIQLSDGLSFEIFENVAVSSPVKFTTAYDEYALQAFKLNSIDYLLKPIDDEDLRTAINKYKSFKPQSQNVPSSFEAIKKLLLGESVAKYRTRFTLKIGQHLKMINVEDVECFYSEHKTTYLHTLSGRNYPIESTLENLEQELDPKFFFRISRKFYVNINHIKDIIAYSNSRLIVKLSSYNDNELIVSRERVKNFKIWLE